MLEFVGCSPAATKNVVMCSSIQCLIAVQGLGMLVLSIADAASGPLQAPVFLAAVPGCVDPVLVLSHSQQYQVGVQIFQVCAWPQDFRKICHK